jgi:PII-like signaling protein
VNLGEARLLRLYVNSDDRAAHSPLYAAVVRKARELGMAGASVFPAELGFGHHRQLHDSMSEYTSGEAPLVIEVIDTKEQIDRLLQELAVMVGEGLAAWSTVSRVEVARSASLLEVPRGSSGDDH